MDTLSLYLVGLLLFILGFLLTALILMLSWNYVVPRMCASIDSTYKPEERFSHLEYGTSLAALMLFAAVFGGLNVGTIVYVMGYNAQQHSQPSPRSKA
jgi:hypothetical protein